MTNFTLSNLDRVSSLFKSKDSTGVFQNLLVSHIQLIDYLIQADFNKISKIDARVSNEIFLFINKNENPSLITLKDSEFKDINQYFPIGILQNTWDIVKPGILKTTNIEIVQLENIKIEKMWNNYGKTLNSPQPLFSLNRISRCNIRHINITSSYIANGGIFKIDHYSFLLSEINEISVKFEDLFFNQIFIEGKTSLLNVTSTVIQPKISVKQLVLDNVNSYTASLMFFSFGELSPSFDGSVYLEPDTYEFEKRFLIIDDL